MENYERELQMVFTESKIIEFDFDFVEKLKIEVERIFRNCKSRIQRKLNEIELQFLI